MWAEIKNGKLVVKPSIDDVYGLEDGRIVGERVGITQSDAKIELDRLSSIQEDYSMKLRRGINTIKTAAQDQNTPARAILLINGDLRIHLSDYQIRHYGSGPRREVELPREKIEVTPPNLGRKEFLAASIPEGGIIVSFRYIYSPQSRP